MEFSNYARIGKAPLIKAIGVQKPHKEIIFTERQELDQTASGCFACENHKAIEWFEYMPEKIQITAQRLCGNCPHAVYKTVRDESYKYVNERNIFGNAPRLKSIGLKLLVIYHFSYPDDRGLVTGLSPKKLAEFLGCTVRSIRNANKALQNYGYIMYSNDGTKNAFQVMLTEYASYALPAEKGGRGYATFNQACLQELAQIKDLNQLRIFLRASLDIDTNKNPNKDLIISQDYDFLRRFLPSYCKPGIIRSALSSATDLFSVVFQKDQVHLKMNPACHGRRNYESITEQCSSLLQEHLDTLDSAITRVNQHLLHNDAADEKDLEFLSREGICEKFRTSSGKEIFVSFRLNSQDLKDLGVLCVTYTLEAVKDSIRYVYEHYLSKFKVNSIGALVRTVLKEKFQTQQVSSLFQNA